MAETKRLIARAAREVPAVMFMGAEPTANPALPELLAYAAARGLSPGISTNAIRLADAGYLRRLHEAGLRAIELSFPYPDRDVYCRITGSPPALFARILRALENIAALNRSLPEARRHFVNVNLVVSAFNVERLPEVYANLRARLPAGGYSISHKRVSIPRDADEDAFRRGIYVPLAVLRRRLPRAARQAPPGVPVAFRDFPLCALPGCERLDADLACWLNEVRVKQNFSRQERVEDMYPESRRRIAHIFDWLCDACGLEPICRSRQLFRQAGADPEHAPRPLLGSVPPRLERWVRSQAPACCGWEGRLPETAEGWTLRELARRLPEGRLPGSRLGWEPLERGILRLSGGGREARVRLEWNARGRRAAFSGPGAPAWASPGVRALRDALRRLPPCPARCLKAEATAAAKLPATLGRLLRGLQARLPSAEPSGPRLVKAFADGTEPCLWIRAEAPDGAAVQARVFVVKDDPRGLCAARVGPFGISLSAPPPLHGQVVAAVAAAVRAASRRGGAAP